MSQLLEVGSHLTWGESKSGYWRERRQLELQYHLWSSYGWMHDHISWNYLHLSLWANLLKFRGPLRIFSHRKSMKLNNHLWVMTQGMTQEPGLRFRNLFNVWLLAVKNYLDLCGFTQSYHVASKKAKYNAQEIFSQKRVRCT